MKNDTPYILIRLQLQESEKKSFDYFYQSVLKFLKKERILESFFFKKIDKESSVLVKILPIERYESLINESLMLDKIAQSIFEKLIERFDSQPKVVIHKGYDKNRKKKLGKNSIEALGLG